MKLLTLLEQTGHSILNQEELGSAEITGIDANSAKIKPGCLFVAISGFERDGHDYIKDAINKGAAAVVGEKDLTDLPVPYVRVANSRDTLANLAAHFYDYPSRKHIMIGITGTNGKTTTSFMLRHILRHAGYSCALFGTVHNVINGQAYSSKNTTPDALELQRLLAESKDDVVIMEVSSHGLSQKRLEGIEFDVGLFTNLAHEHLDYHNTIEEYFEVKQQLFSKLKQGGKAIISTHDEWGQKLAGLLKEKNIQVSTFGRSPMDDLEFTSENDVHCSNFEVTENGEELRFSMSIPGLHNIYNASMAYLTGRKIGVDSAKLIEGFRTFKGIPGRFEMYSHQKDATAVIDYAHTADAFEYILKTARDCGAKRIFHVFGFRGDRDESKRAEMMEISSRMSDCSILTFDDLNGVEQNEMIDELQAYLKSSGKEADLLVPDRTLAIQKAWELAEAGDWILVTGKGSEKYKDQYELPAESDQETFRLLMNEKEPVAT
ncbi:UDP-N-acetylmuramoyl-L-alanyl-D-glutamate--2,6-diaminopimelate ligase [Peribacillus frigoritolerans]|uniref:UDP-N-acetylmuramoyl-L-alanyl-D-glutamate--2, 6-diaminopimelate ligase n=1 Tax=Peribacillus frigoritolerans TaxID=450367 RepID=UPI00105A661B|nr:UDP-N-acetylmuramoyl-L-alanyl-D-glutamate--2,6-diaminopimelate ligase [Peribacillus frigoritolerans]TDL78770.1 UDP-N-acetylmuramoyl-L-alanyl-D-glutamate--2,6-diaminopimelate ligase [Peribacillus frigoritolerans]